MIDYHLLELSTAVNGTNEFNGPPWTPGSPCPTSILARVGTSGGDWCSGSSDTSRAYCRFPNMTTVHSALTHCPAVETLDVWLEVGGCTGPEVDRWDFPFEEMKEGEMYPPLKSLKLDGYSFGGLWAQIEEEVVEPRKITDMKLYEDEFDNDKTSWDPNSWYDWQNELMRQQWVEEGGKGKTNLDWWIEKMDWSQLEELSINTKRSTMVDVIAELPKRLTSLRTLYLDSFPFVKELKEHSLEKLRWVGRTKKGQLEQILKLQGQSLKSMEYRCDEARCEEWPEHVNVSTIAALAPRLQHININLPRVNGTWPFEDLKTLASMSSLTTADLYFRLQSECEVYSSFLAGCFHCGNAYREFKRISLRTGYCRGSERYASPYLNAKTAQEMFSHLRSHKVGEELKEVNFRAGDWAEPYDGPLRGEKFLDYKQTMITCSAVDGIEECSTKDRESYWD